MKTKSKLALLLTVIVFLGYGFKNITTNEDTYQSIQTDDLKESKSITGEELFIKNCAVCHGADRQGNPPTFPSLVQIDKKLKKEEVSSLLKTGRNVMPNFSHLADEERKAIVGFLYGEKTSSNKRTEISSVEKGRNLFVANCTTCHKAKVDDVITSGQKRWGMRPPVLGGISDKYNEQQFKNILNMGPCYMPSFADMSSDDKQDIFSYLSTLERTKNTGRSMYGRGCGMCMQN